jgi:hypothetical protein
MGVPYSNNSSTSSFGNLNTFSTIEDKITKSQNNDLQKSYLQNLAPKPYPPFSLLNLREDTISSCSSNDSSTRMEEQLSKSLLFSKNNDSTLSLSTQRSNSTINYRKSILKKNNNVSAARLQDIYFPSNDFIPKEDLYPIPVEDFYEPYSRINEHANSKNFSETIKFNSILNNPALYDHNIINKDPSPLIKYKKSDPLYDKQNITIKYLKPIPSENIKSDLTIRELADTQLPPYPPLKIRVTPHRPKSPAKVIYRERPPVLPRPQPKVVVLPGRVLPPPPRKLIVEQKPKLPPKIPDIIVHKWLAYDPPTRNVYYEKVPGNVPFYSTKNEIIRWDTPDVIVSRNVSYLGVENVDPKEYSKQFADSYEAYDNMPKDIAELIGKIVPPKGEKLAIRPRVSAPLVRDTLEKPKFVNLKMVNQSNNYERVKEAKLDKYLDEVADLYKSLKSLNEILTPIREEFLFKNLKNSFDNNNTLRFRVI